MRIRLRLPRFAASMSATALSAVLSMGIYAHAQDAGTAVNQGSSTTERILSELRAGKGVDTGGAAAADAATAVGEGDAPAGPPQDGSLAAPAAEPTNQDGVLRDAPANAPADGDLSADGKLVNPADPATPPADDEAAAASARPNARTVETQTDARTVAGRPRPVPEDTGGARVARPIVAAEDAPLQDDVPDETAEPRPVLRPQVLDTDDNPYAPVGYRIGGFRLLPSLTAETLYSDNVRQSPLREGDVALVLRPSATLESQWSRHFIGLDLRGSTTSYARLPSEDSKQLTASLRGRLDVTERANLEGEAAYDFGQLSRSDPLVPTGAAQRPSTITRTAGGAYNQRVNRVSLRLHGTVADTAQSDAGTGGQLYRDANLDFRTGYELSPALTIFGTARSFARRYANTSGTDATGSELRLGIETDHSAKLSGTFSLGGASITSANAGGSEVTGFVADSSVVWLPSALTALTFAASADLELTGTPGATALRNSRVSLDLRHQFRRWLTMLIGISEAKRTYAGLDLTETQFTGTAGFEYNLNREWALLANYQRTNFSTNAVDRSYTEDQVTVGVRLQK